MPTNPPEIVFLPGPPDAVSMVVAAFARSFTRAQIARGAVGQVVVAVDPDDDALPVIRRMAESGGKAIVFGRPGPAVAEWIGLSTTPLGPAEQAWDLSIPWRQSPVRLLYPANALWAGQPPYAERCLWRFDFADEWNNLGYGRIRTDNGAFALSCLAKAAVGAQVLAEIAGTPWCYAALRDGETHSVLWVGRAVGPVDSLEWRMIERFVAHWRSGDLACLPCLEDVPFGYDATVTMRLDCDQNVSSARPLFDLYQDFGVPFSLAIATGLEMDASDLALLDVVGRSGGLVSHSVTHPADWGGSRAAARAEATQARRWLERRCGRKAPYAVSPFHQNSREAVAGLAEAGVAAFIGGVDCNDPEFLLGRSGVAPFGSGVVSQSHQCMLHGDCYHRAGGSLEVYRQAFAAHHAARGILGYLDHPQSASYAYGWTDLTEQVAVHAEWLSYLKPFNLWRPNLNRALDFSVRKARSTVRIGEDGALLVRVADGPDLPPMAISWHGEIHAR